MVVIGHISRCSRRHNNSSHHTRIWLLSCTGLQCLDAIYSANWLEEWTAPEVNTIGRTRARASREPAWEPMASSRVDSCRKRAPYSSRNPMLLTLAQQNPWLNTRTAQSRNMYKASHSCNLLHTCLNCCACLRSPVSHLPRLTNNVEPFQRSH